MKLEIVPTPWGDYPLIRGKLEESDIEFSVVEKLRLRQSLIRIEVWTLGSKSPRSLFSNEIVKNLVAKHPNFSHVCGTASVVVRDFQLKKYETSPEDFSFYEDKLDIAYNKSERALKEVAIERLRVRLTYRYIDMLRDAKWQIFNNMLKESEAGQEPHIGFGQKTLTSIKETLDYNTKIYIYLRSICGSLKEGLPINGIICTPEVAEALMEYLGYE